MDISVLLLSNVIICEVARLVNILASLKQRCPGQLALHFAAADEF